MTDTKSNWVKGQDEDGAPCEYNIYNGRVRYDLDDFDDEILTQEEIDTLMGKLRPNLDPPPKKKTCPDCKGSGEYRGALIVETCQKCEGVGQI